MKKMKCLIFLICMVLLSGCTATYEVSIKDGKVNEKLKLIETDSSIFDVRNDSGWTLRETFDAMLNGDQFSERNYKVKSLNNDNQLGLEYSSSNDSMLNSSILNQCYINPSVNVLDGIVTIDTGSNFKCYEYYSNLDTIKVVFKTNHDIIYTNAEEIDGDSYIWKFTKDSDKQIKISYYENLTKKSFNVWNVVIIVLGVIAIGAIAYFLIKRNKENNSI